MRRDQLIHTPRKWNPGALFCVCFILFSWSPIVISEQFDGYDLLSDEQYEERGLFPPTFNLASAADITTNATCGELESETFCKLVEHVRAPQCGICDAQSANESQRHPITNAIDGTVHWWQSPSLQNGKQFETVTIVIDLKQVYQVAYVIVKAANSPRPGNWILERSVDGVRYDPWLYFAVSDGECLETYGIRPTIGIPRFRSDDEVICTSRYSRLEPLENGEIHMSLVKGRPGVSGPSDKLLEFTAARYVRLRLQKIRTLQGDLMILATHDWERIHKTVTRRLFYSIKDISIGGQCMCFGHAKDCPTDQHTGRLKCRCVHNTCGDSCEKCCPLYNQKQWKVGTTVEAGICEKCQCHGHAEECYYDKDVAIRRESLNVDGKFDGGGVCINCTEFTTGYNCERCIEGYYRPKELAPDVFQPCLPCSCNATGSTGRCIADINQLHLGLNPGDCICKEGFTGSQCSQCAIGYRNYPKCDLCPCNASGTLNTDCEGDCICKQNVDGVRCDRCKPGYFNLDRTNPKGCTECYCFGVSSKCTSANLGVQMISSLHGWLVSDLFEQKVIRPFTETGILTVANDEMTGHEAYYWRSPSNFTGNRLHSYGGRLHFHAGWVHARGDSAGWPTKGPVLVLDGGGLLVAYGESVPRRPSEVVANIELVEHGFYYMSPIDVLGSSPSNPEFTRGPPVNRADFVRVLLSLNRILIQAKFHTDQIEGKLLSVSLEIATETMISVKRMRNLEKCSCPIGYSGFSCESCDVGYRRVNGTLHGGECRKCDCNGHVKTCDPYTGECHECLHDTTGRHCEGCREGFFGLATKGTPQDCRPCSCPLKDSRNNFSPTCETRISNETLDYKCTSCPIGYEGDKCERCADGYFGDPLVLGNNCQPCQCYGHLDISMKDSCDRQTGHCLKCTGNTFGFQCEQCLDGFYGNPLEGDCSPCKCNPFGSETVNTCNKTTGECVCRRRYEGPNCDRCIQHFGNVEGGCEPCDCHALGSELALCSPISGQCPCKPGVFGFKCDRCRDGYFSFSDAGCEWCNCNMDGSMNSSCHPYTGQCHCQPHVIGRTCDICSEGFWNLTSSSGCKSCSCNTTGAKTRACHFQTGQCDCEEGVSGLLCDQCLVGHFGFSERGCKACEPCTAIGHICHPTTGECVCPPLTDGPFCSMCKPNSWGLVHQKGCKPCRCNADGSLDLQCDSITGQCICREGYEGDQCNRCHYGYFAFPKCKPCKCNVDGTELNKCRDDGLCECSENGQCPCKINKEGKKCKQCKMGTFKLPSSQPKGCQECFCFGKSTRCSQAKYTWTRIVHHIEEEEESIAVGQITSSLFIVNGLNVIPSSFISNNFNVSEQFMVPLYLRLPTTMNGDNVLSYSGYLYFTVKSEGNQTFSKDQLSTHPLVQIQGNFRPVIEYYTDIEPATDYKVPLHEDYWKIRNNHETLVTREFMMVVLQNIQNIFVRATKSVNFHSISVSDVSLDVAIQAPAHSPVVAVGVELCQCPPQYNGSSCQDPADGYYRKRKKDFLNSKDILDLVGWAEPCRCYNRSEKCDKETGVCLQCRNNTAGPHCDFCSLGFYGDVLKGRPCRPCACPNVNNSFSDICELDTFGAIQCSQCKEGYAGSRCERCSQGYYGDPTLPDGHCLPCSCHPRGSLVPFCEQFTGQCLCLQGLTGRDCAQCKAKHILTEYGCQSCDDGCTGVLLEDVDNLVFLIGGVNITGVVQAPWEDIYAAEGRVNELEKLVIAYVNSVDEGERLITEFDTTFNLQGISSHLLVKASRLKMNASSISTKATEIKDEATLSIEEIKRMFNRVKDTIRKLDDYTRGVKNASFNLEAAIIEAEKKLEDIHNRDPLLVVKDNADKELREAQALLDIVKKLTNDSQRKESITTRLMQLEDTLNDALRLTQQLKINIQEILTLNKTNLIRLENFQMKVDELENVHNTFGMMSEIGGDLLNDAKEELDEATVNLIVLEDELDGLFENSYRLEKYVNSMSRLLPEYEAKYVRVAEMHADELIRQAMLLNQSFNTIRNESGHALKAIRVYDEIREAVDEAMVSAEQASEAATKASSEVLPPGEFDNLKDRATNSKAKSDELFEDAERTRDVGVQGIRIMLQDQSHKIDTINSTILQSVKSLQMVRIDVDEFNGRRNDVDEIVSVSARSKQVAVKVNFQVATTLNDIDVVILPKLKSLQMASPEGLDSLNKKVNYMVKAIGGVIDTASKFDETKSVVKRQDLSRKLDAVKGLVLAARQRVSSLTLSLSGNDGRCVRSLRPEVRPSATSTISFKFAITSEVTNSFLFFLGSRTHSDFMAIEMIDRRIRFIWNVGHDTAAIEHKMQMKTNEQAYKFNDKWYYVIAQRIGNLGMLSVVPFDGTASESDVNRVSGNTAPGFSRMDLGLDSHFIFGQIPSEIKVPVEIKAAEEGFHGCIYDLQLDGRQVAMWNFIENINCLACKQGPSEYDDVNTNEAYFNGEGYAISRLRTRYHRAEDRYSFAFTFKTLDENALLFFAPNNETGNFLKVSLESGHVVFTVGVGDDTSSHHRLRSTSRHNVDEWTQVEIRKLRSDTQLRIGNEPTPIHTLVPKSVGLKRGHDFYLGGLPPTEDITRWPSWKNLTFVPFLGCLRGVQDDVTAITIADERIYGVERGCRQRIINRLAVPGRGYLELDGHSLTSNSSFGFTFLSFSPNGLLLISTFANEPTENGQPITNAYSVSIKDSQLHLYIASGESVVQRLVHDELLNLTLFHHVFVTRNNEKIIMFVNDKEIGSLIVNRSDPIRSPTIGGLFIGGVPSNISEIIKEQVAVTSSLSGLIRDAVFDYGLLSFGDAVRFEHVGIGRSRRLTSLADAASSFGEPVKTTGAECQTMQVTVDESAVQFGDSPNSYVEKLLTNAEKKSELTISFEFRTRYPNGLLLVMSGAKNTFVALYLNNSNLLVQFNGRQGSGRSNPIRSQTINGKFTNLVWQQTTLKIVFKKRRKKLVLSMPINNKQRRVNVGLPKNFELGAVYSVGGVSPSFGSTMISADSPVREPFRGCIRKFIVNGLVTDLSSGNVRHCFSTVTDGSYFGGDAYAVYANKFNVGVKMDIQLEFRTTLAKGILISVSEKNDSPSLSIELQQGRVVMSVERGDGLVLRNVAPSETTPFTSCDGEWHVVKASYESNAIRIRVDKTVIVYGLIGGTVGDISHRLNETRTQSPLYIGGLPDSAAKGSLMSRDNLIGCIRNLVINEKRYDWIDMPTTHNVLLNSCPTS